MMSCVYSLGFMPTYLPKCADDRFISVFIQRAMIAMVLNFLESLFSTLMCDMIGYVISRTGILRRADHFTAFLAPADYLLA